MNKTITVIKNILLVFIFISIGFILGKNYSVNHLAKNTKVQSNINSEKEYWIDVYYFHSAFRCSTCNKIEAMTKRLLESEFRKQLSNKTIVFKDVDFQTNVKMAEEYEIVASTVVVVLKQNDKTLKYKRLDDVWILIDSPNQFNEYISGTIKEFLRSIN